MALAVCSSNSDFGKVGILRQAVRIGAGNVRQKIPSPSTAFGTLQDARPKGDDCERVFERLRVHTTHLEEPPKPQFGKKRAQVRFPIMERGLGAFVAVVEPL